MNKTMTPIPRTRRATLKRLALATGAFAAWPHGCNWIEAS